jgi:hypothetical protein
MSQHGASVYATGARCSAPLCGRYLHHVTITTGDARRSYREEVAEEALEAARDLLDDALGNPEIHTPIPGLPCTLTASAEGRALIATVWSAPVEVCGTGPMRAALITIGIATHSRSGARLWRLLHQARRPECVTDPDHVPTEPWVAARLEAGVALLAEEMPAIMMAVADLERCLGWAWIERIGPR